MASAPWSAPGSSSSPARPRRRRPFRELSGDAPIADAFKNFGKDWIAAIVYVGALAATLTTVMLRMLGQSRVAFAMSRDRLWMVLGIVVYVVYARGSSRVGEDRARESS